MFDAWPATCPPLAGVAVHAAEEGGSLRTGDGWQELARCLPGLGPVGCLYPRTLELPLASTGLRMASPELFGVPRARSIAQGLWPPGSASVELLVLLDRTDRPLLGLVVLPDTDYFAWDRMRFEADAVGCPRRVPAPGGWLFGARCFELDESGLPACLSARAVRRLSGFAQSRIERLANGPHCIPDPGPGRLRAS